MSNIFSSSVARSICISWLLSFTTGAKKKFMVCNCVYSWTEKDLEKTDNVAASELFIATVGEKS